MIAFGPVPSRRLGYSLGINHIPPKNCSYACVYCQVGRTSALGIKRRTFYSVDEIERSVAKKLGECEINKQVVDYLTLVPDGEPTSDIHLGELIDRLKKFQIPIAVISNASLIDRQDVQDELHLADWVSLKIDSVDELIWRKINRPHRRLQLDNILQGIITFRDKFPGKFVTETLLVEGQNDNQTALDRIFSYLKELNTFVSYFSIPIRPPIESWVKPPQIQFLHEFVKSLPGRLPSADILFDAEPDDFQSTGDLVKDILAITSVHPLREEALRKMVAMSNNSWIVVEKMVESSQLTRILYHSGYFYIRKFEN